MSDTLFYTPYACIPGCMDSNSISFNPWATVNNGACVSSGGGGANSGSGGTGGPGIVMIRYQYQA